MRTKTYRNDYVMSDYEDWKPKLDEKSKKSIKKVTTRKLNPLTEKYEYEVKEINYQLMWESEKELLSTGNFKNKELIKA